jgi:phosphoribosylformylglycinamidine cyclo-ligase
MKKTSYKEAGVDIDAGDALVDRIVPLSKATQGPGVIGGVGGFAALFALKDAATLRDPVIVTSTDGVGTKLLLALEHDRLEGIGHDLVGMCVNDVLCTGARPLVFLDYLATGKLDVDRAERVVRSIAEACAEAGCALVGGETAEMPGMYAAGHIDLAGFAVGLVERDAIVTGERVRAGDAVLALPSTGPHSNGYSLLRRLFPDASGARLDGLLAPTRLYTRAVQAALGAGRVHAIAHITGGGLPGNVPRVLPEAAAVDLTLRWDDVPAVLREAAEHVEPAEMERTFNMGVGLVLVVARDDAAAVARALAPHGVREVGEVVPRPAGSEGVILRWQR